MTFGAWTAAVRILMEKVLFGGKIREDQKIRENIRKILFFQKTKDARRWSGGGPQGAHTTPWRGQAYATSGSGVATLAHSNLSPLVYIIPTKP